MTTESAGDRDAVAAAMQKAFGSQQVGIHAIVEITGRCASDETQRVNLYGDIAEVLADAAISALRARGVSREAKQSQTAEYKDLEGLLKREMNESGRERDVLRNERDAARHSLKCVESERDLARERLSKAYADCSLHQDCAIANAEAHDGAQKEIARLRAALEKIATDGGEKWIVRLSREGCVDVAREALNASKGTT